MQLCFLHAAEDPGVATRFAQAGQCAVEALIDEAISVDAAFVVISGDIFDGDWKDVTTGFFFARALDRVDRLDRKGIPTFIVENNRPRRELSRAARRLVQHQRVRDDSRGHSAYAPCMELARFGYDYWDVHGVEIVARDPWIVYPGKIQVAASRRPARKARCVSPSTTDASLARIEVRLGAAHARAEARPLAA